MTAEIVSQVDAKGHRHHNVEEYLEEGPVDDQGKPASRIRCHKMGFLENITDKMKWYQLRPRPGHSCHLLYGGKRQNDQKEDAEHIEYKRIHNQNTHAEDRAVFAIVAEHIGNVKSSAINGKKNTASPITFRYTSMVSYLFCFFLKYTRFPSNSHDRGLTFTLQFCNVTPPEAE